MLSNYARKMLAVRLQDLLRPNHNQTDTIEIQNVPCTVCAECGQEQIGQRVQKTVDKLLERADKGKIKTAVLVM